MVIINDVVYNRKMAIGRSRTYMLYNLCLSHHQENYVAECSPSFFVPEEGGSHTLKATVYLGTCCCIFTLINFHRTLVVWLQDPPSGLIKQ